MITPTFVLVLTVNYGLSVAVVPELVYEDKGCNLAGGLWKKSVPGRDYFCLPTPTVDSPYLEK